MTETNIPQIKFVTVKPDGSICGPLGDNSGYVMDALCIGYIRANNSNESFDEVWPKIRKIGYSIRKAKIILLED